MSAKYASVVYGNLAYGSTAADIASRELKRPVRTTDSEAETVYEERRVKVQQKAAHAHKQGISVFAVVGAICVAGLFFLILLSYVRLTEISKETVSLNNELETLKAEEIKLQLKYESAFDLKEIEDYAINVLGMAKAGENQVYYIHKSADDRAVVLESDDNETGILQSLSTLLSTFAGFFS